MTITKIISGGQTGADRGALDAAIKLGIPHGGWVPAGRKTEAGPLPEEYRLIEMLSSSYSERTKQNVIESDGTLILSHGKLTGGSALTKEYAAGLMRPCLHIDLDTVAVFQAALTIKNWIRENDLKILNVAGPRASEDPKIYEAAIAIIESVYHLTLVHDNVPKLKEEPYTLPKTVNEAVERLISELMLKDKTRIANMAEVELGALNTVLGQYIRNKFKLWTGNEALIDSCRFLAGENELHPDSASQLIIDKLWKRLRETHKLRVIE
jgi:hypothetical protein